jgi:hypothetical protein
MTWRFFLYLPDSHDMESSCFAGYLSDGTRELAGNYGVHDVVLALGWVKQAIAEFGGDPRQVIFLMDTRRLFKK